MSSSSKRVKDFYIHELPSLPRSKLTSERVLRGIERITGVNINIKGDDQTHRDNPLYIYQDAPLHLTVKSSSDNSVEGKLTSPTYLLQFQWTLQQATPTDTVPCSRHPRYINFDTL